MKKAAEEMDSSFGAKDVTGTVVKLAAHFFHGRYPFQGLGGECTRKVSGRKVLRFSKRWQPVQICLASRWIRGNNP